jgi:hypothetical protein
MASDRGNIVTDPVTRLRDRGILLQQPERDLIADEIERLRGLLTMAEGCASLSGIGVDAHAAVVAVSKETMAKLVAAEAENEQLRAVLKRHHRRCMDRMREEYTESQLLYDETKAALDGALPTE